MTTNSEGEFRITIPVRYQPLVSVSYIGYQPRESVLVAAADNEIRLKEEAQALEEVQVIAYGQQKKVSVTGAIASINTKDLLKSPSGSAGSALAGAVTGISSVQISGQPGAEDPDIYVRGTGSLSNEASKPLILVDGVERSFFQMDSFLCGTEWSLSETSALKIRFCASRRSRTRAERSVLPPQRGVVGSNASSMSCFSLSSVIAGPAVSVIGRAAETGKRNPPL